MKKCPYCAEEIHDEAMKCKYCKSIVASKMPGKLTVAGYLGMLLGGIIFALGCHAFFEGLTRNSSGDTIIALAMIIGSVIFITHSYNASREKK